MKCVYCERTSDEVPLIPFTYKGQDFHICTTHLPMLLHKPEMFEDKLPEPGTWASGGEGHQHHD